MYGGDGWYRGLFTVWFYSSPMYWFSDCTEGSEYFPTELPSGNNKVWTIKMTDDSLVLTCNGEVVLDYHFAKAQDSECTAEWGNAHLVRVFPRLKVTWDPVDHPF